MVNYECYRCGYTNNNKSNIVRHIGRKNRCKPIINIINVDEYKEYILDGLTYEDYLNLNKNKNKQQMSQNEHYMSKNELVNMDDNNKCLYCNKIYKHVLGTSSEDDELVYHEADETFGTYVYKSKSKKYIIIGSYSTLTSQYRILSADDPNGTFKIFSPRTRGLEYSIFHYGKDFYVLTNKDGATNFKLMKTS